MRHDHAVGWGGYGATSTDAARRGRLVGAGLVVCPIVSGLFFGLLSALLVYPTGGAGRASDIGALVGGFMFAANAAALCIVQSTAHRVAVPQAEAREADRAEARAS